MNGLGKFLLLSFLWNVSFANRDQRPNITLYVDEDKPLGYFIGEVIKGPIDIIMLDDSKYFQLESPKSNRLLVAGKLDRDIDRQLCLEKGWPQICAHEIVMIINTTFIYTVEVIVNDVNDNAPIWPIEFGGPLIPSEFDQSTKIQNLRVNIAESAHIGDAIELPIAYDPDLGLNSIVKYELLSSNNVRKDDLFNIIQSDDKSQGNELRPKLVVKDTLDFERQQNYTLQIAAIDGGGRIGLANVFIQIEDENDNSPEFTHENEIFEIIINEDLRIDEKLPSHPKAIDRDFGKFGQVRYRFSLSTSDQVRRDFNINPKTGELSVKNRLDFDNGGFAQYSFTIVAEDGANPPRSNEAKVKVVVKDVNDNAPEIKVSPATASRRQSDGLEIIENLDPRQLVATITVYDPDTDDNGKFSCGLVQTLNFELINQQIVGKLNLYQLVATKTFDREVEPHIRVLIRCIDKGFPSQTSDKLIPIEIGDVNDNPPSFKDDRKAFQTYEGNEPGSVIQKVSAEDPDAGENARLSYKIDWPITQGINPFSINDNGEIIANLRLDRESKQSGYIFTIWAEDNGEPRLNASKNVEINLIDINDCTPEFQQKSYNFQIEEFSVPRRESAIKTNRLKDVGKVTATDCDLGVNARISYEITTENMPFSINSDGLIYAHSEIDRENKTAYLFTVQAKDNPLEPSIPLSSQVLVNIQVTDINDNKPRFIFPKQLSPEEWQRYKNLPINITRPSEVRVSWREPIGFKIAKIHAEDIDALPANKEIRYSISEFETCQLFKLDEITGDLTLEQRLSYSSIGLCEITLKASDMGNPMESTLNKIYIRIDDLPSKSELGNRGNMRPYGESSWLEQILNISDIGQDKMIIIIVTIATIFICTILISIICFVSRRSITRRQQNHGSRGTRMVGDLLAPTTVYGAKDHIFDDVSTGLMFSNGSVASAPLSQTGNGFYFDPMGTIKLGEQNGGTSTYYPFYAGQGIVGFDSPDQNQLNPEMDPLMSQGQPQAFCLNGYKNEYDHYRSISSPNNENPPQSFESSRADNQGSVFKNRFALMTSSLRLPECQSSTFLPNSPTLFSQNAVQIPHRTTSSLGTIHLPRFDYESSRRPQLANVSLFEVPISDISGQSKNRIDELTIAHGDSDGDSGRGGSLGNSQVMRPLPNARFNPTTQEFELMSQGKAQQIGKGNTSAFIQQQL